jgi:hypothetical protein
MKLPRDLAAMLSALADAGVRYLIVGGHAVGVHARPRTTKDLDVWLDAAPDNIARTCEALRAFGVPASLVESLRHVRVLHGAINRALERRITGVAPQIRVGTPRAGLE